MPTQFKSAAIGPSARTRIDIAEAVDIAKFAGRDDLNILSRDSLDGLLGKSALLLDGLRRKPRYFDGRLLTGADLTRDQEYIRQRQNDLAAATGTGVVSGLRVAMTSDPRGQTIALESGHGVTPSGAIVMIEEQRDVALLDIPETRRLDATLGLSRKPNAPLGRRTGLFILALRPVEFSANPLASYPTEITGQRGFEDGDVIEATTISLIAYPDGDAGGSLDEARRLVARQIFSGSANGIPQDALPLAMIALDRGVVRWIDMPMVRRETGADTPLQVAMGSRPRALSEAFVLQYNQHLGDVIADRRASGLDMKFPAQEYFSYLPPAGQIPAEAISVGDDALEQIWFPQGMDVNVSFIPADEIVTIAEESLTLPPIDLGGGQDAVDGISIVALIPVPRALFHHFAQSLEKLNLKAGQTALSSVREKPIASLQAMLARRAVRLSTKKQLADSGSSEILTASEKAQLQLWEAALSEAFASLPREENGTPMIFYARRRAVAYSAEAVGRKIEITGDSDADNDSSEEHVETKVEERLGELSLKTRFNALKKASTAAAVARINELLQIKAVRESDLFTVAAIKELEETIPGAERSASALEISAIRAAMLDRSTSTRSLRTIEPTLAISRAGLLSSRVERARLDAGFIKRKMLSESDVLSVARNFRQPELGQGISRIAEATEPEIFEKKSGMWLGDTGLALEIDVIGMKAGGSQLKELAPAIAEAVKAQDSDTIKKVVEKFLER